MDCTLRYLAAKVRTDRVVLGSDDPLPPTDRDPLASLKQPGFDATDITRVSDHDPRRLLQLEENKK